MLIRIVGHDAPGRELGSHHDVRVGVQRRIEVVDDVPGDTEPVVFELTVERRGAADFVGPFVHGRPGERFLYLVWTSMIEGDRTMFRRAKLQLAPLADLLQAEGLPGEEAVAMASLGLRDEHGGPVCASIRPPRISWSVSGA